MATYLRYSDVPVFANFLQEDVNPVTNLSSGIFAATEVSLSLDPTLSPNRFLGRPQNRSDYSASGPLEGKLALTFIPLIELNANSFLNINRLNQLAFFALTGNFAKGHTIQVSNFLLKRCYLNNYSIKINPYQPISVSANFTVYEASGIANTVLTAYPTAVTPVAKNVSIPQYESLHALSTRLNSDVVTSLPETRINIEINVDCNRTPIYTLGQQTPDGVVLNTVERTVNIQGENVGRILDITGANPGNINISFLPFSSRGSIPNATFNVLNINVSGRIASQQLSVSQGSILNGKVVIKEIIL